MKISRKIDALRALAERPGTPEEGAVAREMLAKLQNKTGLDDSDDPWAHFRNYLRTGSDDELRKACATADRMCECGVFKLPVVEISHVILHAKIHAEIRQRFPRGQRVYYNYWAYEANSQATVSGYTRDWNRIRLKFDHLKNVRAVPIYKNGMWHLSTSPIDAETLRQTGMRGGMEGIA